MNSILLLSRVLVGAVAAATVSTLAYAGLAAREIPDGPVEVVWNKAACAHCRMHLGEPPFAAQVVTTDGRIAMFDDPGCLFEWVHETQPDVHAMWFHELRGDGWLADEDTAFVAVEATPMGFGLGAVRRDTTGAIDIETARQRCIATRGEGAGR